MSKKQLGYELNKTLPIRNRQDKIFSYMLDQPGDIDIVSQPHSRASQAHIQTYNLLEQLKRQVQVLKDKDAVSRLNISKITTENQQLKAQLADAQHRLDRQDSLIRADRVYIQTLDRQVRRLKELLAMHQNEQGKQNVQSTGETLQLLDFESQNQQLLQEIEMLMLACLKKNQRGPVDIKPNDQASRKQSRGNSKKKQGLR